MQNRWQSSTAKKRNVQVLDTEGNRHKIIFFSIQLSRIHINKNSRGGGGERT